MTFPKPDLVTSLYVGAVLLCGLLYTCFGLTPSSYGVVLSQIGAPEQGPVLGTARGIRADEWAASTPYLQAAVRNGFRRTNETSFYREDLRCVYVLPLQDWSLIFKPELWAFFLVSPATAFSFYYALLMCGFLIGYFLLFRQMDLDPFVAAPVAVILYFSGFTQFFWTTFASLTAGLPWILLILFAPLRWWLKALLLSWTMPVLVFSYVYPTLFTEFTFATIVLIAVIRPWLFRSPRDLAAVAIGLSVTGTVFFLYYQDLIPVMRDTWYPGKRISGPGTMPITVAISQIFPFLSFTLRSYRNLTGTNICEIGAIGSFFPLLTYCLSPAKLERPLRRSLIILAGALALISAWQLAPVPQWIGHILLWDHGDPERLLFIAGFLLTVGSLLLWRGNILTAEPRGIVMFVVMGPVLSLVSKAVFLHVAWADLTVDLLLSALGIAAGMLACFAPAARRLPLLLGAIALMNVVAFGRFNPLQPAAPIFETPETDTVAQLRQAENSTPGHILLEPRFLGSTLNGLGFRSVNHTLLAPRLSVFREYFRAMDEKQFDFLFNRYGMVGLTDDPLPELQKTIFIRVPVAAFEPVRNVRMVSLDVSPHLDCSIQRGGVIERTTIDGNQLTIEGWAPWKGEDTMQSLHVTSQRPLQAGALVTVKRPDVAEAMKDYGYARAGFRLQLTSTSPIRPEELAVVARGTSQGLAELSGCGCSR